MSIKKLLFGLMGLSNLAVLVLVFGVYFQNNYQTSRMYSLDGTVGTKESDLKDKIKKQCGKELENVINGKRSEFICGITIKGREKGSSYVLKTKVTLKKGSNNNFIIEGLGSMNGKTRYATEADFCDSCKEKSEVASSDVDTVFGQIFDIAQTIDQKAASSVINAQEVYRKKDLLKRNAILKQRQCKGEWNESDEEFIEYDIEETLTCKISKLNTKDFRQKEVYYNNHLKKDFWNLALSDDHDLLDKSTLYKLQRNHFRHNLSVQNSTSALSRYLDWKSEYESGSTDDIEYKLNLIVKDLQNLSNIDKNLSLDYQYLTQNHPHISISNAPINDTLSFQSSNPITDQPSSPITDQPSNLITDQPSSPITDTTLPNPTSLKDQVQDLY